MRRKSHRDLSDFAFCVRRIFGDFSNRDDSDCPLSSELSISRSIAILDRGPWDGKIGNPVTFTPSGRYRGGAEIGRRERRVCGDREMWCLPQCSSSYGRCCVVIPG